jgi:hypothetical protein
VVVTPERTYVIVRVLLPRARGTEDALPDVIDPDDTPFDHVAVPALKVVVTPVEDALPATLVASNL